MSKDSKMKKKSASKTPMVPESVLLIEGSLQGMEFTVMDYSPAQPTHIVIKYQAPNNGPRAIVTHHAVRGKFNLDSKREDVRIAFSGILHSAILWDVETGYSCKKTGQALVWDYCLGRFVPAKEQHEGA
jgi:hypothetical protein